VHNLVQNSLDAIEDQFDGRVDIITRTVRNEQGNPRAVRLYVRDNGPGFSAEVVHRAFEPYVTTKAKGTGLGLAVVRKIADEHHARIRIGNQQAAIEADSVNNMNKTSEKSSIGAEVSLSFPLLS
jgi:nitrogen fixation/metabolism regulation signal transduction histidine kinase